MNMNTSENFHIQNTCTHAPQMNTLVKLNNPHGQSRSAWDVVATPCHTEFHKVNDNITSPRYFYLPEHFPTQKWDINWPHTSINHLRVTQSRLKQVKYHISVIWTGLHRYHRKHQAKNSSIYCTEPRKKNGYDIISCLYSLENSSTHTYGKSYLSLNRKYRGWMHLIRGKKSEITKGYPIFGWSPGILIMEQADSEPENEEA